MGGTSTVVKKNDKNGWSWSEIDPHAKLALLLHMNHCLYMIHTTKPMVNQEFLPLLQGFIQEVNELIKDLCQFDAHNLQEYLSGC